MIVSPTKWAVLGIGLLLWACASSGRPRDFTFEPSTNQTFPEAEEAKVYKRGLSRPHRVIGAVRIEGEPGESQDALEKRLVEGARKVGAHGVIVLETGRTVSEVGRTGIRQDLSGGASKQYRRYPSPVAIEVDRIYVRGMAIRFLD